MNPSDWGLRPLVLDDVDAVLAYRGDPDVNRWLGRPARTREELVDSHFAADDLLDALAVEVDLRDRAACDDVVARTVDELGGLDVLVNNAGYQMAREEGIEAITDENLDRVLKTNLYATFWLTRAAVPHLRERRGSVVNNTSIQAYEPSTSLLDYASTKAALNNLTVNLAAELGGDGIRVNAVAPGPIWTPLQPATQPPEKLEQFGSDTPLGRAGQPAEVAPAFVFLASERDASYVSGTVLGVTGGKPVF